MPRRYKQPIFIDRDPNNSEKGWGWVDVYVDDMKRFEIPHQHPRPRYYDGNLRVVRPPSRGKAGGKKFVINIDGDLITVSAQKSLTIGAICYWVQQWAPPQAKIITPCNREMSVSMSGEAKSKQSVYFVYFISNADSQAIKIGIAKNVERRLKSLQTASPAKLQVLKALQVNGLKAAQKLERALHQQFRHLRLSGEWFRADSELVKYINEYFSNGV